MAQSYLKPAVVLLIEDDLGDQELTRRAIGEGTLRANLRIVGDGEAALDYLYQRGDFADPMTAPPPDLILLDLNMPKLGGREVLKAVKSDPKLQRVPIVVLTTSQQEIDVLSSYELGCNSFIVKPVDADGFMRSVQDLHRYWFQLVTLPDGAGDAPDRGIPGRKIPLA